MKTRYCIDCPASMIVVNTSCQKRCNDCNGIAKRESMQRHDARRRPPRAEKRLVCKWCDSPFVLPAGSYGRVPMYCMKCRTRSEERRPKRLRPDSVTARRYQLKSKYGITLEQWDSMWLAQDQRCAICATDTNDSINWCVDHDHITGKVRAILCRGCNVGLGAFRDNPEALRGAAVYIERFAVRPTTGVAA